MVRLSRLEGLKDSWGRVWVDVRAERSVSVSSHSANDDDDSADCARERVEDEAAIRLANDPDAVIGELDVKRSSITGELCLEEAVHGGVEGESTVMGSKLHELISLEESCYLSYKSSNTLSQYRW
ncbi:hypothetical protein J1614_012260 [Plenodomus biglobosus]|nr:hypothetical protein J1614_012260 [Plenodomus biglobosus]